MNKRLGRRKAQPGLGRKRRDERQEAPAGPGVAVVEVIGQDTDGELLCQLKGGGDGGQTGTIILSPGGGQATPGMAALGIGDLFLARLAPLEDGTTEARLIRRLSVPAQRILGVYRADRRHGRIEPTDKKARHHYMVAKDDALDTEDGDLVLAEPLRNRLAGLPTARVIERLGPTDAAKTFSLISIFAHGLSTEFPAAALAEAEGAKPLGMDGRTDLRQVPLITIDPEDARDHDDAVWAAHDPDPRNPGGFQAIVAIADVAAYVPFGSALDKEARRRGNSTYFPDRVVPMLPERLSADLCSLIEGENRPVLAVHLTITSEGRVKAHRFERAMMRSAASLSYEQAQAAIDGVGGQVSEALLDTVLRPLWACYGALAQARDARHPLDLDVPEFRTKLGPDGRISAIGRRVRLDAHRLIEEFMIQANVAAAETVEARKGRLIYRVHDQPNTEKLQALSDFLRTLNIKLAPHGAVRTPQLSRILSLAADDPNKELISEIMLRSQSLAVYDPENIGHFGLNLRRYAHFTSPIRRYADLIVHRALIRFCGLGEDGLSDTQINALKEIADTISACERRSMAAEREANERYLAAYMADQVGATFAAKISGVTRFGLFVRLDETGADGLVPMRALGQERFNHDTKAHALIGARSGRSYRLGQRVTVTLVEATPITGGLRFELADEATPQRPSPPGKGFRTPAKRRR